MSTAETLADELGLTGWLREAVLAVPRQEFAPGTGWAAPARGPGYPIDRAARPREWLRAVFSDAAVVTQWEDGPTDPGEVDPLRSPASSSLSAPGIAFGFLDLLAPRPGDRVLEIGTGTGYTAAVLAERVGGGSVTSIEVDPAVAAQAAENLKRARYAPHLVVGDGAQGHPGGAPFDRVHATCAVRRIPGAWVAQSRPGGAIVAPWQPGHDWGWMVRLTADGEGAAHGRLHGRSGYMMLRGQRTEMRFRQHHREDADISTTELDPRSIADGGDGAELAITALAPDIKLIPRTGGDGAFTLALYEMGGPGGSWAVCEHSPGADRFEVAQYGARRLWDEAEAAYLRWVGAGSPDAERFGLTVGADGRHRVWLDSPRNPGALPDGLPTCSDDRACRQQPGPSIRKG
ncbi:methyltransferase domain-containing protein [Nocardiopsis sp. CNT-189]|uniref:methyltransferase domain-containing protein n=1 Tax=Nocardiopsis oceanisediminis TaxID=2816862 RepID=UPI003B3685F1